MPGAVAGGVVFRLLAIGVIRVLARDSDAHPDDVLPFFGGSTPPAPSFSSPV